jgi:hypothetical protein
MKTMLIDLKVYVLNKPTIEKQIKTQKTRSGATRTRTMFQKNAGIIKRKHRSQFKDSYLSKLCRRTRSPLTDESEWGEGEGDGRGFA